MRRKQQDNDRERILVNIAALLASELASLQALPILQDYLKSQHCSRVRAQWFCRELRRGDLVVCGTSAALQQNPWIISFVEENGIEGDPGGALLRAIGTDALCNYGNESFTKITGIPERLLWSGEQHKLAVKVSKAFKQLGNYTHRFRGLQFDQNDEHTAYVFVGECFGGLLGDKKTKPYRITIKFGRKTTIKSIISQMEDQGFGKRDFEPDDGSYEGPMQGVASFTKESLTSAIEASGFNLDKDTRP